MRLLTLLLSLSLSCVSSLAASDSLDPRECFRPLGQKTPEEEANRQEFDSYLEKEPRNLHGRSTKAENAEYKAFVASLPEDNVYRFLHIALKPMRELNKGNILDSKTDVDKARNLFREIFLKRLHEDPTLRPLLLHQLIDFKTMEFAFKPIPDSKIAEFEAGLSAAFRDANLEFERKLRHLIAPTPEAMLPFLTSRGLVSDLTAWHQAAVAKGHPDYAANAVRFVGFDPEKSTPQVVHRFNTEKTDGAVRIAEAQRLTLEKTFGQTSLMAAYGPHKRMILSQAMLDMLRKYHELPEVEFANRLAEEAKKRFHVRITPQDAKRFLTYYQESERFNPPVRATESIATDFAAAKHGVITVDFAKQGVVNSFHTMGAVAEAAQDKQHPGVAAIPLARKQDAEATARLQNLRDRFAQYLKKAGIKGEPKFSGDDGGIILPEAITSQQYIRLLEEVAKDSDSSNFRIVFSQPGSRQTESNDHTYPELLEKDLREKFLGVVDEDELYSLGFGSEIDIDTGELDLFIVGKPSVKTLGLVQKMQGTQFKGLKVRSVRTVPALAP